MLDFMELGGLSLFSICMLFLVAVFAGFIDSIVGGGGLITLPALLISGIPPHLAIATNKLQSVFGSATAAFTYFRHLSLPNLAWGVVFTALGAWFGAWAVLLINSENLKIIILIFLTLTFIYTAIRPNLGKSCGEMKMSSFKLFHVIFGLIIGFYDGFLGPGTGSFWIFACVIFLGFNMKTASINTKILNFTSNIASLIFFIINYKLIWLVGILMGIGQVIGAVLGSILVLKTNGNFIRALFLVVVFATIVKVAYDYFLAWI